jgi:hypothetical protein
MKMEAADLSEILTAKLHVIATLKDGATGIFQ